LFEIKLKIDAKFNSWVVYVI